MERAIAAAESQADDAARRALRARDLCNVFGTGTPDSHQAAVPLAPNGACGRSSELVTPPPTPAPPPPPQQRPPPTAPTARGGECEMTSPSAARGARQPQPPPACAPQGVAGGGGGFMALQPPASGGAHGGGGGGEGVPPGASPRRMPQPPARLAPRISRGVSLPQSPEARRLAQQRAGGGGGGGAAPGGTAAPPRAGVEPGRQQSQPPEPTTSRQVSHVPRATLRRGLSTLRSDTGTAPLVLRLRDPPMATASEEAAMRRGFFRKEETRSLRREYLQQHRWTNQFKGSQEVEDRFHRYVTEYQLERVQRRLWLTAAFLGANGCYSLGSGVALGWAALNMLAPAAMLSLAGLLITRRRVPAREAAPPAAVPPPPSLRGACADARAAARAGGGGGGQRAAGRGAVVGAAGPSATAAGASPAAPTYAPASPCVQWWRLIVLLSALCAYNTILWSDWAFKRRTGAWGARPALQVVWQLVWLLLAVSATVLNAALDFVLCVLVSVALYLCFAAACAVELADAAGVLALPPPLRPADGGGGAAGGGSAGGGGGGGAADVTEECVKALLSGACGVLLFLIGAHRINRFERHSFVQQYLLWGKVEENEEMIAGAHVEFLALFANPTLPARVAHELGLKPLKLGQELRFLLRTIPKMYLEVQPAATLADATSALEAFNPRIIMFSGHTFMGALAFELANGRIDTHSPPDEFVSLLRRTADAPNGRIEAVFLNGCLTTVLGCAILESMPWLKVVCWNSITEDQAARAFAVGFVDAIGAHLSAHELRARGRTSIDEAFVAGCVNLFDEGFHLGDPQAYLHGPKHPHAQRPDFSGNCFGCLPPVHGDVVLLKRLDGATVMLRCTGVDGALVAEHVMATSAPGGGGGGGGGGCAPRPTSAEPSVRRQGGAGATAGATVHEEGEEQASDDASGAGAATVAPAPAAAAGGGAGGGGAAQPAAGSGGRRPAMPEPSPARSDLAV